MRSVEERFGAAALVLLGVAFRPGLLLGQDSVVTPEPDPPVAMEWYPETPAKGSLIFVSLRIDPDSVGEFVLRNTFAQLANQPLHFDGALGVMSALGGVPLAAEDSVTLRLTLQRQNGEVELVYRSIPVVAGDYGVDQLTVAPEFGRIPDSITVARIRRDIARAREVSRTSHRTPRLWQESFALPRDARITSGFGRAREFNGELQSRHTGLDLDGLEGDPVKAMNRGVVSVVDEFYYGGNVIYLNHGAGLVSAYMHLSDTIVAEGDTVEAGQLIGSVGQTGRVTGPHLHWMVRYGDVTVDPLSLATLGWLRMPVDTTAAGDQPPGS